MSHRDGVAISIFSQSVVSREQWQPRAGKIGKSSTFFLKRSRTDIQLHHSNHHRQLEVRFGPQADVNL
jgi:hypothetical protein